MKFTELAVFRGRDRLEAYPTWSSPNGITIKTTAPKALAEARDIAMRVGLKYVYIGSVSDPARESTYCPSCGKRLIERDWWNLSESHIRGGACEFCGQRSAGHFEDTPGHWGRRRLPEDPAQLLHELAGEPANGSQSRIAHEMTRT